MRCAQVVGRHVDERRRFQRRTPNTTKESGVPKRLPGCTDEQQRVEVRVDSNVEMVTNLRRQESWQTHGSLLMRFRSLECQVAVYIRERFGDKQSTIEHVHRTTSQCERFADA